MTNFRTIYQQIIKDESFKEGAKDDILNLISSVDLYSALKSDILIMYYILEEYAEELNDELLNKYYLIEKKMQYET